MYLFVFLWSYTTLYTATGGVEEPPQWLKALGMSFDSYSKMGSPTDVSNFNAEEDWREEDSWAARPAPLTPNKSSRNKS